MATLYTTTDAEKKAILDLIVKGTPFPQAVKAVTGLDNDIVTVSGPNGGYNTYVYSDINQQISSSSVYQNYTPATAGTLAQGATGWGYLTFTPGSGTPSQNVAVPTAAGTTSTQTGPVGPASVPVGEPVRGTSQQELAGLLGAQAQQQLQGGLAERGLTDSGAADFQSQILALQRSMAMQSARRLPEPGPVGGGGAEVPDFSELFGPRPVDRGPQRTFGPQVGGAAPPGPQGGGLGALDDPLAGFTGDIDRLRAALAAQSEREGQIRQSGANFRADNPAQAAQDRMAQAMGEQGALIAAARAAAFNPGVINRTIDLTTPDQAMVLALQDTGVEGASDLSTMIRRTLESYGRAKSLGLQREALRQDPRIEARSKQLGALSPPAWTPADPNDPNSRPTPPDEATVADWQRRRGRMEAGLSRLREDLARQDAELEAAQQKQVEALATRLKGVEAKRRADVQKATRFTPGPSRSVERREDLQRALDERQEQQKSRFWNTLERDGPEGNAARAVLAGTIMKLPGPVREQGALFVQGGGNWREWLTMVAQQEVAV